VFASGIVIHTPAGVSSLVVALVLGPRHGFEPGRKLFRMIPVLGDSAMLPITEKKPHNLPMATVGAALLWVGWFGFNGGSALTSGSIPSHTILTTHIAACVCGAVWVGLSWLLSKDEEGRRRPSYVEALNGVIAGLAGITPASGFVSSQSGFAIGAMLGFVTFFSVILVKRKLKIDDALDVSSVHGVAGIFGSLMIGFFSSSTVNPAVLDGLFFGGDGTQLGHQAVGVVCAGLWALVWTLLICLFLEHTIGFRVTLSDELIGLDSSQHGETARINDITSANTTVRNPEFWQEMSNGSAHDDATCSTKGILQVDHENRDGGVTLV
jgi:Amt family ammonium transporter